MSNEIKSLRKQYNLSQSQLALRIGISVDSIRKWEQGFPFKPTKRTKRKLDHFIESLGGKITKEGEIGHE